MGIEVHMSDQHTLYVIRHAIAAARGARYPDDAARPLTGKGRARFRQVARGLARLGTEVDLVLSSPLIRARQTADILSEVLPGHPSVVETDALLPDASFVQVQSELGRRSGAISVALVGHQPSIGEIAACLAGAGAAFDLKKGGVCCVDVAGLPPATPGRLRWLATPKMLVGIDG
jgi:phosphohistidine phosphatase